MRSSRWITRAPKRFTRGWPSARMPTETFSSRPISTLARSTCLTKISRRWFRRRFLDIGIPAGFAPFNIQNIGGRLYVTYAKQDADKEDDVAGPGNGFVDLFDTNGTLVRRVATQGALDSPWGLAVSPANFGEFSNA